MKPIILLLIFSPLFMGVSGCNWFKKSSGDEPAPVLSLPPVTQKGANTFGCFVNGKLVVDVNKCRAYCPNNPWFDPSIGFFIGTYMDSTADITKYLIGLKFDKIRGVGVYNFDTIRFGISTGVVQSVYVRKYLGDVYYIASSNRGTYCKGQHVHHWMVQQKYLKTNFAKAIGNQPWNLMPMPSPEFHRMLHSTSVTGFSDFGKLYYGTPTWFKSSFSYGIGSTENILR